MLEVRISFLLNIRNLKNGTGNIRRKWTNGETRGMHVVEPVDTVM